VSEEKKPPRALPLRLWLHKDGEGFDVVRDSVPVNDRVVVRLNKAKKK
jgi:hypothetical protein